MPAVNLSFNHGHAWDAARANFDTAITQAAARHSMWIRRVEWTDDRTSARLFGPGYSVLLTLDERQVHVVGSLPFFPKFLEARVRKFLAETLGNPPPKAGS
jgi:hypothetical protein